MYLPQAFAVDAGQTRQLLAELTAGDLVTATDEGILASYLPLLLDPGQGAHGVLLGHLARLNPQWRHRPHGEALVIARGPDGYVSPSWYPSKAEHGRVVPTWNYSTVHVYGELVVHDDVTWLEDVVRRLTDRHEAARPEPWSVDDAPPAFLAGQLRAIVGVELVVSRVEAKVKMSQNRPAADVDGVVAGLAGAGRTDLAEAVHRSRR